MYEFTVVNDDNSAILARVSKLLGTEGFKPISQFSPDPRANGCRVIDGDGAFEKQTRERSTNRWFSVTYLTCDGKLKFDINAASADSFSDDYKKRLVNMLRAEFKSEIASGQIVVKTKEYVALGP